jgi:hypothetical protein
VTATETAIVTENTMAIMTAVAVVATKKIAATEMTEGTDNNQLKQQQKKWW